MTRMLNRPRVHTGELSSGHVIGYTAPWSAGPATQQTEVLLSAIGPLLADVLIMFKDLDRGQPANDATPATSAQPTSAVEAVRYVADALGVPETDVLACSGIAERTYHDWKTSDRKPRLSSLGQLWKLSQAVTDLAEEIPDLITWFRIDPTRRDLLRRGHIDELAATSAEVRPADVGRLAAGSAMAGPEREVDATSRRRSPARAAVTPRRPGRSG